MWSIIWVALIIFLIRVVTYAIGKALKEEDSLTSGFMIALIGFGAMMLNLFVLYGWFLNILFRYLELDIRYSAPMGVAIICVKLVFETLHED